MNLVILESGKSGESFGSGNSGESGDIVESFNYGECFGDSNVFFWKWDQYGVSGDGG